MLCNILNCSVTSSFVCPNIFLILFPNLAIYVIYVLPSKKPKNVLYIPIFCVLERRQDFKFSNRIITDVFRIYCSPTFIINLISIYQFRSQRPMYILKYSHTIYYMHVFHCSG